MAWVDLEVPMYPRTRRTADGTFYTHDGQGRIQVREHHVPEMLAYEGVRHVVPDAEAIAAEPPPRVSVPLEPVHVEEVDTEESPALLRKRPGRTA